MLSLTCQSRPTFPASLGLVCFSPFPRLAPHTYRQVQSLPSIDGKDPWTGRLGNEIGRVRMVFKYDYDQALIDKPIRYGQSFQKPSRKVLRIARSQNGKRMFEADELRRILNTRQQPIKAMTLLGINCGFGQSDLANFPQSALDLVSGWIDYPRPKTGI